MRARNRLSAKGAASLGAGKFADGGGLWLYKTNRISGKWVFRVTVHGKRREMGLGGFPDISLSEARKKADRARAIAQDGLDPIKEREKAKREAVRNLHMLSDVAIDAFEARKAELKGDGKAGRWFSPLELHVLPRLGKMPVSDIDQIDIRDTLSPIWHSKAETAKKALNRLSLCLKHGAALGLDVDLQAPEKARALLGKQRHEAKHIPAMPWADVPAFYHSLTDGTVTQLALRLLILTGVRSAPIRFAHLDQFEGNVWTIPADLVKGRKGMTTDFKVPLSQEARAVVQAAKLHERNGFLFPGTRKGVISDATMSKHMSDKGIDYRPHGFRSSFRDWTADTTNTPFEVAETAIGHTVGGSVERAYRRTDYLEQRRVLHERWAQYITGQSGQVVRSWGKN
ncbi:Integrase [Thalassovita litoralis]|uniref:Integrase n=1 Tax=Thalassovita litoralis TaxID=1010611 RepID=A0A521FLL9_9RHOB|nr:site-specific integrase [Thalassovita litoralis]SMO96351.1 Integrase [Thalassovita litoralis]